VLAATSSLLIALALAAILTAALTWIAIGYARRRALIDLPGRRRSHRHATARGGGIAIVVVAVASALLLYRSTSDIVFAGLAFGMTAVALVGWVDDHRPLSARARLLVHFAAAIVFVACLPPAGLVPSSGSEAFVFALRVVVLVTAINFFNFIDGINGLLATQAAWVATAVALLFALAGNLAPAWFGALLAAACLGFLPFNFPRARIFPGDVGSGGLGFACGALLLWCEASDAATIWLVLPIASAVAIDAGLTLSSRILRRRRWYTAHREHLYQWMVRSGHDHASTTLLYLGWNFIIVLPVLWMTRSAFAPPVAVATGAMFIGAATWYLGKRGAIARVRRRGPR
jgi:UDP-N-acetylmuramyl pentapeptide phosphotransferase/UDP-N-acetylglucosamine-1-phosphate transferase